MSAATTTAVRGVLFDLDGTLIDSAPDLGAAVNTMRVKRGLPELPDSSLRPYASHGARGLVRAGFNVTPEHGEFGALRDEFLAYYATATYVTFTTGFIMRMLTEDRVVATLAHELGHFYRSHANMPTDVVNYFYSLDTAHAHTPPPDPRTIEQTAKVREKIRNNEYDYAAENALMKERNLGFYTTEQEADEIALEMLSNIGVPPNVAIDMILELLKMSTDNGWLEGTDAIKWAECTMLRDQGFRDADGKLVTVPVGDPINAHHNGCFRVFNMMREMQAHRYQLGTREPVVGVEWSTLLTQLGNEIAPAEPLPPHELEAGAEIAL